MYIALTQPEFPAMKATVRITPVAKEGMKIKNSYQKNFWESKAVAFVLVSWLLISIVISL
jgi:hypothetical protein